MRIRLAIIYAKFIKCILTILKRRGGSLPGKLAMKICPNPLSYLSYPSKIILVTGTNGKTTTTNMVYQSLKAAYANVIGNYNGDNLIAGITTLLLTNTSMNLKIKADVIVIEVDEITVPTIIKQVPVSHMIINNLFRDQLDRAGEMESIIRRFEVALQDYKGVLILNGDDPNVARLGYHKETLYFGVEATVSSKKESTEASEGKYCFNCSKPLVYEYYHYSHIGRFKCAHCDFGEYTKLEASQISHDFKKFDVNGVSYISPYATIYAIYNCMAVIALATKLGVDVSIVQGVLQQFEMNDGRMELFSLNRDVLLNLIKNPTGANEVIKYINQDKSDKDIWLVLNDNGQDGRDVSWIYDVNFDYLLDETIKEVICSGTRALDMALCIKYHNFKGKLSVFENDEEAVVYYQSLSHRGYIMVTYTALQKVRQLLQRFKNGS